MLVRAARLFTSLAQPQDSGESRPTRRADEGPGWTEVFVTPSRAGRTGSAAEAVAAGHSLLVLHELADGAEVEALRAEASGAAYLSRRRSSMMKQALLDDVPEEAVESTQVRMPIDQMLGEKSQALCDRLLLRGVRSVMSACPTLLPSLFGDAGLGSIPWADVRQASGPSITHDPGLVFTPGEPACNVYTTGGQFTPHEDGQTLTVLVVLSERAAFSGGGTGFWSEADRGAASRGATITGEYNHISPQSPAPTFVLTPPAGTALVWGGTVTHAAETVLDGERTVFVAGFSNKPARRVA